ncbi:MAG TPA: hypothetical protein VJP81_00400 [Candidatus Dormibacteraeota bacterium]|nr:hypothetical protein [Candidatus Dormibacteraeota bacterium]
MGWGTENAARPSRILARQVLRMAVLVVSGALMLLPPLVAVLVLLGGVG